MDPALDFKYKIIALILIFVSVIIIIVGIIFIHELPYKIACKKNNSQKDAIRCMALMGLFMLPLWFLAMIWAYTKPGIWNISVQKGDDSLKPDADNNIRNIRKNPINKIVRSNYSGYRNNNLRSSNSKLNKRKMRPNYKKHIESEKSE